MFFPVLFSLGAMKDVEDAIELGLQKLGYKESREGQKKLLRHT